MLRGVGVSAFGVCGEGGKFFFESGATTLRAEWLFFSADEQFRLSLAFFAGVFVQWHKVNNDKGGLIWQVTEYCFEARQKESGEDKLGEVVDKERNEDNAGIELKGLDVS